MLDRMTSGARKHWWIGLAAIFLWIAPVSLWSQESPISEQVRSTGGQPFSGIDDTLTGAADALLASAVEATASTNGPANGDETSSADVAPHYEQQPRQWSSGPNLAAARVDLLRPAIEPILRSHGVPADLVAVILVESGGRADALSPKGARGLWQLMPDTARRYGLRVDKTQDDRLDLFKATDAAARYLHDLYEKFGDWKLALAAYNTGEANVGSAITRAHSQDCDQLASLRLLPFETRNYVPRVLAAIRTFGQPSSLAGYRGEAAAVPVFATSDH